MIFVTVGTHEQPFNRLIKEVDRLKQEQIISEEVFIQTGYSDYSPKYCQFKAFLSYTEMEDYMNQADLIICHGGPSTFMGALSRGKKVIVVPRLKKYNEHVNDHQLDFLKELKLRNYIKDYIKDISDLEIFIKKGKNNSNYYISNNAVFCEDLKKIIAFLRNKM